MYPDQNSGRTQFKTGMSGTFWRNTQQISVRYQSILVIYQLQVDPAVHKLDVYRKIDL